MDARWLAPMATAPIDGSTAGTISGGLFVPS